MHVTLAIILLIILGPLLVLYFLHKGKTSPRIIFCDKGVTAKFSSRGEWFISWDDCAQVGLVRVPRKVRYGITEHFDYLYFSRERFSLTEPEEIINRKNSNMFIFTESSQGILAEVSQYIDEDLIIMH